MLKILCFGTFDGVHDGHRAMLKEAKEVVSNDSRKVNGTSAPNPAPTTHHSPWATNFLVVVVAPDSVVKEIKGTMPQHSSSQRIAMLKKEHLADEVILGDSMNGSWGILRKTKPNVIALGYDQDELRTNLEEYLEKSYPDVESETGEWIKNPKRPRIITLSAHKPDIMHNKLLRKHNPNLS